MASALEKGWVNVVPDPKDPNDKIGTDPEFRNREELEPVADAFDEAWEDPSEELVEDESEEES